MMDSRATPKDLADPVLLSKIDKFFELSIGEYVALPQVSSPIKYSESGTKAHEAASCWGPIQVSHHLPDKHPDIYTIAVERAQSLRA